MSKEKQIELLEKQLAFWKHHCTELANELKKEEEIANHYAEMLDKTEEELNDERVKNEEQGYRKQSEVIDEFAKRLKDYPINVRLPLLGLETKEEIEAYVNNLFDQIESIVDKIAEEMKGGE